MNSFTEIMSSLLIDQYQEHIAELELTLPQAQVLRVLRRGPLPTGHLAAQLKISAPAITQLTDRLSLKGLIERRASTNDRRTVIVALSERGSLLVDQFRQRRGEIFRGALAHLSREEQGQVVEVLGKVVSALQNYDSATPNAPKRHLNTTGRKLREAATSHAGKMNEV
ncbi:MAG TPA: MarR family transcriptional regulator [Pyrinomonadaceae bacterium]|nr:MarR family transcriptional regulator [Pyrinomonadaceae bacterium]